MVGDEEDVASLGHVAGPCLHHFGHGGLFARRSMHSPVLAVPVDGARDMPGPEVVEGMALGRVTLSHVVRQRPDVSGVARDEGL